MTTNCLGPGNENSTVLLYTGESEPLNKLKEALSSKESFTKHYLVSLLVWVAFPNQTAHNSGHFNDLTPAHFDFIDIRSHRSVFSNTQELSELAMGTYKHIGRMRSARLIGKDLADFYMFVSCMIEAFSCFRRWQKKKKKKKSV